MRALWLDIDASIDGRFLRVKAMTRSDHDSMRMFAALMTLAQVCTLPGGSGQTLGGMTGSNACAGREGPKCSVTFPPKIAGGRSVVSSCMKFPQVWADKVRAKEVSRSLTRRCRGLCKLLARRSTTH